MTGVDDKVARWLAKMRGAPFVRRSLWAEIPPRITRGPSPLLVVDGRLYVDVTMDLERGRNARLHGAAEERCLMPAKKWSRDRKREDGIPV